MAFIKNLNADSLNMPPSEFNRYMRGEIAVHDPYIHHTCEGLRLMKKNEVAMSDIKSRQEKLMAKALQLQQDLVDFCASFQHDVKLLRQRAPLKIRSKKSKVDLDAEDESSSSLPPPLQPQVLNRTQQGLQFQPLVGGLMGFKGQLQQPTLIISCTNSCDNLDEEIVEVHKDDSTSNDKNKVEDNFKSPPAESSRPGSGSEPTKNQVPQSLLFDLEACEVSHLGDPFLDLDESPDDISTCSLVETVMKETSSQSPTN